MSTENRDRVRRALREFRKYAGDGQGGTGALPIGDPASGAHNPPKSLLREALEPVALGLDTVNTSVAAAAASETAAASSASAAASSASDAQTAKTQADLAAISAGAPLFVDATAGLAGTVNGDIFLVSNAAGMRVYQNTAGTASFLGWLGEVLFNDVAALLASTLTGFVEGNIIRTRTEGFSYEVAASAATDQHLTTAGGVKLYVQPGSTGYNIEAFAAVGDGVADDTAADAAARTAAGENGSVYYPAGTYRIASVLDRPLARAYGPGNITDGVKTWPVEEVRVPYRVPRVRTVLSSVISDVDYSHYPSGIRTIDGRDVIGYHVGLNHGQADNEAICRRQSAAGAGNLTINGNEASGGTVTARGTNSPGHRVQVVSAGNDSGITFTISGNVNGVADTEVLTGANVGTVTGAKRFTTVTQVETSGATASTVRVGLFTVPSNVEIAVSDNSGQPWSKTVVGDGLTRGDARYYQIAIGQFPNGDGVALLQKWDMINPVFYTVRRTFDGFRTYGPEETVVFTGDTITGTPYLWGQIHTAPDGRLVCGCYSGSDNGVATSGDGVTWDYVNIVTDGGTQYSEPNVLPIDANVWLCLIRIDGVTSAWRLFRSLDGGATWADFGATNLPVDGGYASPSLGYLFTDGGAEVFSLLGSRQTAVGTPIPNAIISRYANDLTLAGSQWSEASRIVASFAVTAWALSQNIAHDGFRLYSNGQTYRALQAHTTSADTEPTTGVDWEDYWERFNPRGGYPAHWIDPTTGEGWLAYGKETGFRQNSVIFERFNARKRSIANYHAAHQVWTPTLVGATTAGAPAYSTQYGRWTRLGPLVIVEFDLRISGAFDGTGFLQVHGLPFRVATANSSSSRLRITAGGTLTGVSGEGAVSANHINLHYDTAGGASLVQHSMIGSGFRVEGSFIYMTKD